MDKMGVWLVALAVGLVPGHVVVAPAEIAWGEAPPVFEKGASFAVVSGDPGKAGLFVIRLKLPAGYRIAPHWHPTDEHVTVLSGTFGVGMGDRADGPLERLTAGGYALMPATMHHYAVALSDDTIVQVHGLGPLAITYVNPADDPSTRRARRMAP